MHSNQSCLKLIDGRKIVTYLESYNGLLSAYRNWFVVYIYSIELKSLTPHIINSKLYTV